MKTFRKQIYNNTLYIRILFIILNFMFAYSSNAQVDLQWESSHPGMDSEPSHFIVIDSSNNVFTIGEYGTITKFNHFGDVLFIIEDTLQYPFEPKELIIDADNRLIVIGIKNNPNDNIIKVRKLDLFGNLIWNLDVNLPEGTYESINDATLDPQNNIYLTGHNGTQFYKTFYSLCISKHGILAWKTDKTPSQYGNLNVGMAIVATDSNNIYAVGIEHRPGNGSRKDAVTIKYDRFGTIIWSKKFSYHDWQNITFGQRKTYGKKIDVDSLGNSYIIAFDYDHQHSVLVKYNNVGDEMWVLEVDPTMDSYYETVLVDNGFVYIGGGKGASYLYLHPHVVKLDFLGNIIWEGSYNDEFMIIKQLVKHNDGVVLIGDMPYSCFCGFDFITIRFDDNGTLDWVHEFTTNEVYSDEPFDICIDKAGGIYITGSSNGTFYDSKTYKLFDCQHVPDELTFTNGTFYASEIPGAHYTWVKCENNSTMTSGMGNSQYTPWINGTYMAIITIGDCVDTTNCVYSSSTGLNESNSEDVLNIYPNPTSGNFVIENLPVGFDYLQIIDTEGRVIILSTSQQIDVSYLTSGMYVLRIITFDNVILKRLIKN